MARQPGHARRDSLPNFAIGAQRGYGTSSEYVRELIRKEQDRSQLLRELIRKEQDRSQLRTLFLQAAASPVVAEMRPDYFTKLRARLQANGAMSA